MAGSLTEYLTKMSEMMESVHASNKARLDGWRHRSIEAFILAHGVPFIPAPLPKGVHKGTFKECFSDAYKLASRKPDRYIYCEGYATSHIGIPVLHAWDFDTKRGVVVDRTWHDNRGQEYFGVPFNINYVNTVIVRTEVYGILGNLYMVDDERNPLIAAPSLYLHPSRSTGGN
jgi:hypothetical protein